MYPGTNKTETMERYDPQSIEAKWQKVWADERSFHVPNPDRSELSSDRSKSYVVEMLPYPSGDLHMGHTLNYTIGDVITHLRRRQGMQVLRPMGYDAFGLPAENAAIKEGGHPRIVTERNIASIREQMHRMGWAFDWSREISTHDPAYYRWTQWLFLRFYERGLAYRKEAPVKWCPNDQTVLANEQVVDGRCERCGAEVEAKSLTQWFFRITDYADALLDEMELLEHWPERVLTMQRNWIGRSHGARVVFSVEGSGEELPVFTTRPDNRFIRLIDRAPQQALDAAPRLRFVRRVLPFVQQTCAPPIGHGAVTEPRQAYQPQHTLGPLLAPRGVAAIKPETMTERQFPRHLRINRAGAQPVPTLGSQISASLFVQFVNLIGLRLKAFNPAMSALFDNFRERR